MAAAGNQTRSQQGPLACVTGATGFVAAHVVRMLLAGGFRVRGTVRSTSSKKCEPLRALPHAEELLELVEADLLRDDGWAAAVAGCDVVFHVASPFFMDKPKDIQKDLVEPARDGTTRVVRAAIDEASVRRLVVTSSVASVIYGQPLDAKRWDEADWTVLPGKPKTPPYPLSKTLAERRLWELIDELQSSNPERAEQLQVATICPGMVFGPTINHALGSESANFAAKTLNGDFPMLPDFKMGIIDVRDVAKAHLRAAIVPQVHRRRFILVQSERSVPELARAMAAEMNKYGYKVPTSVAPNWLLWVMSCFGGELAELVPSLGRSLSYDTTPLHDVLGMTQDTLVDANDAFVATGYSVINLGLVQPKDDATRAAVAERTGSLPELDLTGIRATDFEAAMQAAGDGKGAVAAAGAAAAEL